MEGLGLYFLSRKIWGSKERNLDNFSFSFPWIKLLKLTFNIKKRPHAFCMKPHQLNFHNYFFQMYIMNV